MKRPAFDPLRPHYEKQLQLALKTYPFSSLAEKIKKLNEPILTFKNIQPLIDELSYKKINDWDAKGLISGTRENEKSGWRRFSPVDLIKFFIISDLREVGVDIDEITALLGKLGKYQLKTASGLIEFPQIEFFLCACFSNAAYVLVIDHNKTPYFLTEDAAVKLHFLKNSYSPLIILPFYFYASYLKSRDPNHPFDNRTSIKEVLATHVTAQEIKIINIIRNEDFQQINLKKLDGDEIQIKAKSIKQGNFSYNDVINAIRQKNYQTVSVQKVDGKTVSITQEESIRV